MSKAGIKKAIEFYEEFGNFNAKVVNLKEYKTKYICDIILTNDYEGTSERYEGCTYIKDYIVERVKYLKEKKLI